MGVGVWWWEGGGVGKDLGWTNHLYIAALQPVHFACHYHFLVGGGVVCCQFQRC